MTDEDFGACFCRRWNGQRHEHYRWQCADKRAKQEAQR